MHASVILMTLSHLSIEGDDPATLEKKIHKAESGRGHLVFIKNAVTSLAQLVGAQ